MALPLPERKRCRFQRKKTQCSEKHTQGGSSKRQSAYILGKKPYFCKHDKKKRRNARQRKRTRPAGRHRHRGEGQTQCRSPHGAAAQPHSNPHIYFQPAHWQAFLLRACLCRVEARDKEKRHNDKGKGHNDREPTGQPRRPQVAEGAERQPQGQAQRTGWPSCSKGCSPRAS